jgi:hypothetical protein
MRFNPFVYREIDFSKSQSPEKIGAIHHWRQVAIDAGVCEIKHWEISRRRGEKSQKESP